MSPQFPKLGVYYRIQNVDLATFLSVADMPLFKPRLVTRPLKEHDKSQLWQFENEGNGWRIVNRSSSCCHNCSEDHGEGPACYLEINDDGPLAKLEEDGGSHQVWVIKRDHHSPPGIFRSAAVKIRKAFIQHRRRIHLYKSTSHLSLEASMIKMSTEQTTYLPIGEASKWRIAEVWPSLSAGNYRIRGLSGLVLDADDSGNVKARPYVHDSKPEWEIIPEKNGNCKIKVAQRADQYISGKPVGLYEYKDHIRTTASEFEWTLVRIGSIGYSIVMNRKKAGDSLNVHNAANQDDVLAITMGAAEENQEIGLAEYKGAHGQIWIFEKEPSSSEDKDEVD